MQLTLGQIYQMYPVISKIINHDMPVRLAFKLSKMAKKVNEEYTEIEKQRSKLIQKYGEPAEEQGQMRVKNEHVQSFVKELDDLFGETVELDIELVSIESLPEDTKLTPQDLSIIELILTT